MTSNIVSTDLTTLIDSWMKAEQEGVQFPVPFETAWVIAGYSRKDHAMRKLTGANAVLVEDEDFAFLKSGEWSQNGRSSDLVSLTCDSFKQFCLMAKTEQGRAIRLYFIEAEKKWKLLQQIHPEVAEEIDLIHAKQELARLENQRIQSELQLAQFRHLVTTTMPVPTQLKILGAKEIPVVEYRDRIVRNEDFINDGSTATKTELCHRYGIKTGNGKPDYKRLKQYLDLLPNEALGLTVRLQDNYELRREWLPELDRIIDQGDRNLFVGE